MSALPADRSAADRHGRKRRGWRRDQRGSTAVEFALVALPFLFILFSITEVCVANAVSAALDNATNLAARQIMTGQLTLSGTAATTAFKTKVCDQLNWLGSVSYTHLTLPTILRV